LNGIASGDAGGPRAILTIEEPDLPSGATQIAFAGSEGMLICSVHTSGEVLFWHSSTGGLMGRLDAHEGPCSMVGFPLDRSLMATCGRNDMLVKLWDLSCGVAPGQVKLLQHHQSDRPLNAVALRPSLSRSEVVSAISGCPQASCDCLIGGGQDARDVALVGAGTDDQFEPLPLRMNEGTELVGWQMPGSDEPRGKGGGGHFGPIHALAFTLDTSLCISASEDGNVRLRELAAPAIVPGLLGNGQQTAPHGVRQHSSSQQHALPPQSTSATMTGSAATQVAAQVIVGANAPTQSASRTLPALIGEEDESTRMIAIVDFDPAAIQWPQGAQQNPLPLRRGQELEVLHDFGGGWAFGRAVANPHTLGLFPTSYALPRSAYQRAYAEAAAAAATTAATAAVAKHGPAAPIAGASGSLSGFSAASALSSTGTGLAGAGSLAGTGLASGGLAAGGGLAGRASEGLGVFGHTAPQRGLPMPTKMDEEEEEGDCSQS